MSGPIVIAGIVGCGSWYWQGPAMQTIIRSWPVDGSIVPLTLYRRIAMSPPTPAPNGDEPNPLLPDEQAILDKLHELAAAGVEEVDQEFIKHIDATIKWSFDDPESVKRSLYFMARDPFHRREVQIINAEFAAADAAALEKTHGAKAR